MTVYGANGMLRKNDFKWADHPEVLDLVKTAWAAGDSCKQIAIQIGETFHIYLTRNAVIGKIHRLEISATAPHKEKNQNHPGIKRKYRRAPWAEGLPVYSGGRRVKPELTDLEPETSANPIGFFDLQDVHCRWPVSGVGYQTMFCGDPVVERYPYCAHHCRIAYRTVSQMRAEAKAHALVNGSMPFIIRSSHIT